MPTELSKKIAEEIFHNIDRGLNKDMVASIIDKHLGDKSCKHDNGNHWITVNGTKRLKHNILKDYPTCPFCPTKEEPMTKESSGKEYGIEPMMTESIDFEMEAIFTENLKDNSKENIKRIFREYFSRYGHKINEIISQLNGTPRPAPQEKKLRLIDHEFAKELIADCQKIIETLKRT